MKHVTFPIQRGIQKLHETRCTNHSIGVIVFAESIHVCYWYISEFKLKRNQWYIVYTLTVCTLHHTVIQYIVYFLVFFRHVSTLCSFLGILEVAKILHSETFPQELWIFIHLSSVCMYRFVISILVLISPLITCIDFSIDYMYWFTVDYFKKWLLFNRSAVKYTFD